MSFTLSQLADHLAAELHGDPNCRVDRVATLANAGAGSVSFLSNRKYRSDLDGTRASAVILEPEFLEACPVAALVTENPYIGYARAAALLNPEPMLEGAVHPTAWMSEQAEIHPDAWVGPQAVIEAGARVGARARIGPGCVLGRDATIGADSRLSANVTISHDVRVGERVIIHSGVVIGADGFGIANERGVWIKVPQLGGVSIGDDVEIGANTTIDRGALEDTVIENGVKLDNLIQVGHNVRIGAHSAIAACVAIGGSARIGKHCAIGGAASIAGHLEIADGVQLTATSAVASSIREPGVYSSGMPVQENKHWRKNIVRLRQLDDIARRLKHLEVEFNQVRKRQ